MIRIRRQRRQAAVTLVEVLFTIMVITFSGTATLAAMIYGQELRASIEARNAAVREAANMIESIRATPFHALRSLTIPDVTLDSRGTEESTDDLRGTVTVKFYDAEGNEISIVSGESGGAGETASAPPPITTGLEAQVSVYWNLPGRRSGTTQSITLTTFVAP